MHAMQKRYVVESELLSQSKGSIIWDAETDKRSIVVKISTMIEGVKETEKQRMSEGRSEQERS